MAIGALILGESGTGKTYSVKNFTPEEVKILSLAKPILPFRGKYEIVKTPTGKDIIREMKNTKKKVIVIDDFQYLLGVPMMKRIGEKGWDKFGEIEQPYSDVLDAIGELPDDTIVYLTSHVMYNDDTQKVQIKTVGKALDKYITIEGLFMIVLGTKVVDGKYYFVTQNNGANTLKSPEGMFPSLYIPNDLKYVDDHIRNYYYMDGAKTDEEMAAEDAEHKVDENDLKHGRRSRKAKEEESEESKTEPDPELEKPKKRSRKKRELKLEDEDTYYFIESENNVITVHPGDEVPEGAVKITKEQFTAAGKEVAVKGADADVKKVVELAGKEEIPFDEVEEHPGLQEDIMPKPQRRRRRRGTQS